MVFIIIVILSLIATYLLISSGIFKNLKWFKKGSDDDDDNDAYEPGELIPGMFGSVPSDTIDVFDSKKPIVLPMEPAINSLIESFKQNATTVYTDFNSNRNSPKYKEYIFDDYKLRLLKRGGALNDEQLSKYFTIHNTVVKDINYIFNYYLDKIKYSDDRSYYTLRREGLNENSTRLTINEQVMSDIENYVLSNTKVPGSVIILLKYKVNEAAQELIDQVVMLAGYNYTTALETLEQVLIRDPLPGISLLGIVNSSTTSGTANSKTMTYGFWSQVYSTFTSNNVDNTLIANLRLSFMTENVYRSILSTLVSQMQNPKLTDSMNNLVKLLKSSDYRIVKTFPYYFTYVLVMDTISENRLILRNNRLVNVSQIDKNNLGTSNIDSYSNIQSNFPVAIQELKISDRNTIKDGSESISLDKPTYPILSDDYMVNNYLSFPNIRLQGLYFDRTTAVTTPKSGYILISNYSSTLDIVLNGVIIYGFVQGGTINGDYKYIDDALLDDNVIINPGLITLEAGTYGTNVASTADKFSKDTDEIGNWLVGNPITISHGKSLRIRATKLNDVISKRYLRIMSIMLVFKSKPVSSDFLKLTVIHDRSSDTEDRYNVFSYKLVPKDMTNILFTFDSNYNISTSPPTAVTDTLRILSNNLKSSHSRLITSAVSSGSNYLPITNLVTGKNKDSLIVAASGSTPESFTTSSGETTGVTTVTGLTTDTYEYYSINDPNSRKRSNRIRIRNTTSPGQYNPIRITKMIVYGKTNSTNSFTTPSGFIDILSDNNILYRDTINVFRLSTDERQIDQQVINKSFVIDPFNSTVLPQNYYEIASGDSIYIEPFISKATPPDRRWVNVRAIYMEFDAPDKTKLELSITQLNVDPPNRIAMLDNNTATTGSSISVWADGSVILMFTGIGNNAPVYSNFSVLPSYQDNFSTIPKFMEERFQNDFYDQYYNPISELTQYPSSN